MNRKNAVFAAHKNLVVVNVTFEYQTATQLSFTTLQEMRQSHLDQVLKTYSYCALSHWIESPQFGDLVLVPARGEFKIARFIELTDVTALDLDTYNIQYKWILGFLPQALIDRYLQAGHENEDMLRQADRARAEAIQASARQLFMLESDN